MTSFSPRALPTGIGSMPHLDADSALAMVLDEMAVIPYWPQLPRRHFKENMYVQFSQDLPTIQLDEPHEWIGAVVGDDLLEQVESFYTRYLEQDPNLFAVSPEYAAGLYGLCERAPLLHEARWIKGQVTGPISFGLQVTDQNLRPILYDDTLRDVLVKHVTRKAQWQEQFLSNMGKSISFVDEPSLALIGASVVALNRDEVIRDLEEVYAGIQGLKGTHCCGNTDWGLLLNTSVDVISLDAFTYAENLALFAPDVKQFLNRGGALAWGIVPTVEEEIRKATVDSLVARLDAAIGLLVKKGIDRGLLYEQALITPACGLGSLPIPAAERALSLTRAVSGRVRARERLLD